MQRPYRALKLLSIAVLAPVALVLGLAAYWETRTPPSSQMSPLIGLEHWAALSAGEDPCAPRITGTDLTFFKGAYFLVHAQGMHHGGDDALVVRTSPNLEDWEETARIAVPGMGLSDPKFAIIKRRLFLYFLPTGQSSPMRETTYWSTSQDGVQWAEPQALMTVATMQGPDDGHIQRVVSGGWVLRSPKTRDLRTWYTVASGWKPQYSNRIAVLIKTRDGVNWEEVSEVYTQHETHGQAMEFTLDGSIVATLSRQNSGSYGGVLGNPTGQTVIATALRPFTRWSCADSPIACLDDTSLFRLDGGQIFAVGRDDSAPLFSLRNGFRVKRIALYEVGREQLLHFLDLPSHGDPGGTGTIVRGDAIFVSYYTSPVEKEYP